MVNTEESTSISSQATLNGVSPSTWFSPLKSNISLVDTSSESYGTGGSPGSCSDETMMTTYEKESDRSTSPTVIPSEEKAPSPITSILSPPNRLRQSKSPRRVHFSADVIEASSSSDSSSLESDSQESPVCTSLLFDSSIISREHLEKHVEEMALKMMQLQSDLSLERTLSKRKQRGFIQMAKEMAKKVAAMEQMDAYVAEVTQLLQETREAYATAENDRQRLLSLLLLKQQQLDSALQDTVPNTEKDISSVTRSRYFSFVSEPTPIVNNGSRREKHGHNECILTIITLSFGISSFLLIVLHPELFSRSWWCGPAMPGSMLKPHTLYEAPWWMPVSSYKAGAFQAICFDSSLSSDEQLRKTSLEWKNQNLQVTKSFESKSSFAKDFAPFPNDARTVPFQGVFGYHYELMSSASIARKRNKDCQMGDSSETTHSFHSYTLPIDSIHIPFKPSHIDILLSESQDFTHADADPTVTTYEQLQAPWDS